MKEPETFLHKLSGLLMQQGLLLFSTFVPRQPVRDQRTDRKRTCVPNLRYTCRMAIRSRFQSAASGRGYDRPYLQNPTGRTETPQSNGRHSDRKRLLDKRPARIILPAICGTVRDNRRPSDTHNNRPFLYISNQKNKKGYERNSLIYYRNRYQYR